MPPEPGKEPAPLESGNEPAPRDQGTVIRSSNAPRDQGTLLLAGTVILVALGGGYLGAQMALRPWQAALQTRPPVVVLDLASALKGVDANTVGQVIAAKRDLAARLAEGGVLVLDAQAVLAAPTEIYLKRGGPDER